jgi:hypothetical protein
MAPKTIVSPCEGPVKAVFTFEVIETDDLCVKIHTGTRRARARGCAGVASDCANSAVADGIHFA